MDFPKYENAELCKICGGKCCKKSGCYFHPQDFPKIDLETLQRAIDSGKVSIAGDIHFNPNFSYDVFLSVKARNKGQREIELFTVPGECASLTDTGCEYSLENRPTGGTALIPKFVNGEPDCDYGSIDEEDIVFAWAPYQNILRQLVLINANMDYLSRAREDIFIGYCNLLSGSVNASELPFYSHLMGVKFLIMFRKEYQRAKKELQLNGYKEKRF